MISAFCKTNRLEVDCNFFLNWRIPEKTLNSWRSSKADRFRASEGGGGTAPMASSPSKSQCNSKICAYDSFICFIVCFCLSEFFFLIFSFNSLYSLFLSGTCSGTTIYYLINEPFPLFLNVERIIGISEIGN